MISITVAIVMIVFSANCNPIPTTSVVIQGVI